MKNHVNFHICIFMNNNENVKHSIKTREKLSKSYILLTMELTQGTQKWHMMDINDNRILFSIKKSTKSHTIQFP